MKYYDLFFTFHLKNNKWNSGWITFFDNENDHIEDIETYFEHITNVPNINYEGTLYQFKNIINKPKPCIYPKYIIENMSTVDYIDSNLHVYYNGKRKIVGHILANNFVDAQDYANEIKNVMLYKDLNNVIKYFENIGREVV